MKQKKPKKKKQVSHWAKLTPAKALWVLREAQKGEMSQYAIAVKVGISQSAVSQILSGHTYKKVTKAA